MSREKMLLLIAIIGILVYTTVNVILPLRERVVQNDETILLLTRELELTDKPPEVQEQHSQELQSLQARHELLDRKVPHKVENAEMIVLLSTLAEKFNLQQMHLSESPERHTLPGQKEMENQLSTNTFFWKGSGFYSDVKDFLKALEESDRLLAISDVKLLKNAKIESESVAGDVYDQKVLPLLSAEPQLSVSFYIKTYYDPTDPGSDETSPHTGMLGENQGSTNPFQ